MYREVNWASSEGGGSLGSVGKGKVGTAKAALCVKVDPRECAKPLTKIWASPGTRQVSDPLVTSSAENEISISSYAYLVVRTHPCFLTGSENIIRQANSTVASEKDDQMSETMIKNRNLPNPYPFEPFFCTRAYHHLLPYYYLIFKAIGKPTWLIE
jgi:hypothetical protein